MAVCYFGTATTLSWFLLQRGLCTSLALYSSTYSPATCSIACILKKLDRKQMNRGLYVVNLSSEIVSIYLKLAPRFGHLGQRSR